MKKIKGYEIKNRINKIIRLIKNIPLYLKKTINYLFTKEKKEFQNKLCICAIMKNEGAYIEEWIIHHLNIGCSKIILYDNDSNDDTYEIIKPFIEDDKVIYNRISGRNRQYDAYNDAIEKYKDLFKYIAFIDCDEFLMPCNTNENIIDNIESIMSKNKKISGIAVNWRMYGSSGLETKPNDLVLNSYLYRADDLTGRGNNCIKSIVNPRRVFMFLSSHYPFFILNFYKVDENGIKVKRNVSVNHKVTKIRLNHYFTKSKEEWIKRRSLGKSDTKYFEQDKRTIEEFYEHDNNDIYDEIGLFYGKKVLEELKTNRRK